jgi:hypothetical protein
MFQVNGTYDPEVPMTTTLTVAKDFSRAKCSKSMILMTQSAYEGGPNMDLRLMPGLNVQVNDTHDPKCLCKYWYPIASQDFL